MSNEVSLSALQHTMAETAKCWLTQAYLSEDVGDTDKDNAEICMSQSILIQVCCWTYVSWRTFLLSLVQGLIMAISESQLYIRKFCINIYT